MTLNTFFFWASKPLDAKTPIALHISTPIAHILVKAGLCGRKPYTFTPLDFVLTEPAKWDVVSLCWDILSLGNATFLELIRWKAQPKVVLPATFFGNHHTRPPRSLPLYLWAWGAALRFLFYGLYLYTWDHRFPTLAERALWRASVITTPGIVFLYLAFCLLFIPHPKLLARLSFQEQKPDTFLPALLLLPRWLLLIIVYFFLGLYGVTRLYVLVESFLSLRELPADTFTNIQWSNYLQVF